jgi:hypothetical protein
MNYNRVRSAALAGLLFTALSMPRPASAYTLAESGDSTVNSAYSSVNFGGLPFLQTGGTARTYVQFDLSSMPLGIDPSQITRVNLVLWVNRVGTAGTIQVSEAGGPWTESSITAASQPATTGASIGTAAVSSGLTYVYVDVTNTFKNWLSTPSSNQGVVVDGVGSAIVYFDSKESVSTSHPPSLEITVAGPVGATGSTGAAGAIGATGLIGATGPTGTAGAAGPTGATGTMGATGAQGSQGLQGATGATGAQGTQGIQGAIGVTGATGATGPTGSPVSFQGTWSNLTTYAVGDAVFFSGSSYISLSGSNVGNTPTTGVPWALLVQQGSNGAAGATGATGANGSTGAQGIQGATGATGAQGIQGAMGLTGATGATGPTGSPVSFQGTWSNLTTYAVGNAVFFSGSSYISLSGSNVGNTPTSGAPWALLAQQGSNGAAGATGATGGNGATGAQGIQGIQGATGATGATGAAGDGGTGANPTGIPFNLSPHTLSSSATVYLGPTSGGSSTSASPTNSAIMPASCTPSMTIYSYGPTNSITYSLMYVTPNSSSSSWAVGSSIMSCTIATGSSSGGVQSCSVTAGATVSAGSVLTIAAPAQTSASGNTGAFVGFSCL